MEDFIAKLHERRFVRVVISKLNVETKSCTFPDGLLGAVDDCLPLEEIVLVRHSIDSFIMTLLNLF